MKTLLPGTLKADALLLLTALIWGVAFVAQRAGMDHMGPFIYNAVRFGLGAASLLPVIWYRQKKGLVDHAFQKHTDKSALLKAGIISGLLLFLGSSLQQVGIVYTTAGKAGFITGLYVVIVPVLGLIWKIRPGPGVWLGALLAASGLYFLTITDGLRIEFGDFLVLLCAVAFALHVLAIGWLVTKVDCVKLAAAQFLVTSVLSFIVALVFEEILLSSLRDGLIPILYGGIMSAGVAYTLQIVAQREALPGHAAIILSLESVFAVIAGWMILSEYLGIREISGCILMFSGMLAAQIYHLRRKPPSFRWGI
ncbi:DMT family transporter [Desulfonatronovibrio hydrogenovorans]|uniref:DMT family transporter n=1 Tax=Desulfonatronovibrio hydrogenovorans TaxID=53245 RepID=UPI00048AF60C|nr:DMT family transporter [Desulfonatronovibrio hydrogenovorans]